MTATPGRNTARAEGGENPLIPNRRLKELYAAMVRVRMLEKRLKRGRQGRNPSVRDFFLEAAVIVGAASHLRPDDTAAAIRGAAAVGLLRGVPLAALLAPGTAAAMAAGAACNLLPGAGSAEVQLAMAAGAAFAGRARGSVAMTFCDDATMAANRGLLALAGRYDLPVLFVVEQARDGRRRRYRTEEHGFPTIPVDSRDVVAVYRVAQESIAKARLGSGPTLIECLPAPRRRVAARRQGTMRKPAQDQLQERLQDQLQDPIEAMEQYLAARGLLAAGARRAIEKEFSRELDQAARRARPSPRRAAR